MMAAAGEREVYWSVASIDVGTKNFAVYVERALRSDLEAWYTSSTACPPPGQCRWKVVWDLSRGPGQRASSCATLDLTTPLPLGPKPGPEPEPGPGGHTPAHLHLLWNLGTHAHVWDECHLVLVEKQLNRNPTAIRLEMVCRTFFAMRYPAVPCVSYPAKFKTVVLGGPVGRAHAKSARKAWASRRALEICEQRGDGPTAEWFRRPGAKRDDVADALLMVQAWKHQERARAAGRRVWPSDDDASPS